jgi:hypothetical protein
MGMSRRLLKFSGGSETKFLTVVAVQESVPEMATA